MGDELVARLPSASEYAPQIEKEHRWLPQLAPRLPIEIPRPVALGKPGAGYPWRWSVSHWIDGEPAHPTPAIAKRLGEFLGAMHAIDATGGPASGSHNFHRGGELRAYDDEVKKALDALGDTIDGKAARRLWHDALRTRWSAVPVWVHGDISAGNLLSRDGRLAGVIDFGNLAIGDPACDLAIAWAWFDPPLRDVFQSSLEIDANTWLRARAWALWKALIVAAGMARTNAVEYSEPRRVIAECLSAR